MDLTPVFLATLSNVKDVIQQAESQLKSASLQPGFSLQVLKVVANEGVDSSVRQAASVSFKNHIKYHWLPSETDLYAGAQPLSDGEKAQIKAMLPGLMLSTPALVQAQLSEALSIVCSHDFPKLWPNLLTELVERLSNPSVDLKTVNGVLATANSIFKRYRNQYGSDAMVAELVISQNAFAAPLLETTKKLSAALPQTTDPEALKVILSSSRYASRIFFSLNAPGLTPLMESQLDVWMAEFHTLLTYENPSLTDEKDTEKESPVDALGSAVCQNINLFMETNEEEFQKYLSAFVSDVWHLLMKVSLRPGQDPLVMNAIKFLTTVSRSVHYGLFSGAGALQQICEKVVVPNSSARAEDEEVFETNPLEYIRRDVEGSDSDTRRRAAADLVKSLVERFPSEVTQLFTGYIQSLLQEYARDPARNWRAKDTAIYLVLALTVQGKTGAQGATSANPLVNILDFYTSQVLPELQSPRVNENPVLKADAIKFVTTFRSLLPKDACLSLFPHLIQLLASEYNVVHSYSALALEKMLSLRDPGCSNPQGGPRGPTTLRFTPADLGPNLQGLLERLFGAFKLPESGENEYLMKAVMRVVGFVGPAIIPVAPACLQALAQMLVDVCKNPKNPGFNHYLFESVACLIKHAIPPAGPSPSPSSSSPPPSPSSQGLIETFEQMLFPAFNLVLQQDVQEFHPYVFQVFAQLIELRSRPLPPIYLSIFPPLLNPMFWERSGNIPALVLLVQAFLSKAGDEVVKGGHLVPLLGVFQKLVASKAHDHEGFHILSSLLCDNNDLVPLQALDQYLPTIWQLLFSRLQTTKTDKFVRCFVRFLAEFIVKHGPLSLSAAMDKVQPGILLMLLQQVWLPHMSQLLADGSTDEEKVILVATTKCLCESALIQNQSLWVALRDAAKRKTDGAGGKGGSGLADEGELEDMQGYSAAYAKLANASRPERPVLAEIQDPMQYLETSLARIGKS